MGPPTQQLELERWVHDHVIRLLERGSADKLTPQDRRLCADVAARLRHQVLGDDRRQPASVGDAVDHLRIRAAELGLAVTIYDAVGPYTPNIKIVTTIFAAAENLLTNVADHAGRKEAIVTVKATPIELTVTVADRGPAFDAANVEWSPVTQRVVFDALEEIDGEARIDDPSPGHGTRWILRWRGEPD